MNQILFQGKNKEYRGIIIALIVLLVVVFTAVFAMSKLLKDKILANVYIGDVDVGMQTKEKAIELISGDINKYNNVKIRLILGSKKVEICAQDIDYSIDKSIDEIVGTAYEYGRKGNVFSNTKDIIGSYFDDMVVDIEYTLDEDKLMLALEKLYDGNASISTDDTYEISGDKIYINKGSKGIKIDIELAKKYIATAFTNNINSVEIPTVESENKKVDLDKIYDLVHVAPQNASFVSGEKFELIVDKDGKDFDLKKAQSDYDKLGENETLTIEVKTIGADTKIADLDDELFKNILSTYSTTYDQSVTGRVQNLKVAAERCNNTILYPGDEFSYNKTLGARTIKNGFAVAHSFANGRVVDSIGGGICQVSSTLYNVVLEADLEVTNRVAHGMYVEYVKPSLDATVVYNAIDFKFKNNRKYPVKILSSAENGVVTVSLYGISEANESIIEIESVILETLNYKTIEEKDSSMKKGTTKVVQEPVKGYISEAYKIVKNKDGSIISKTLISKDKYIATDKIIKVGTKETVTPTPIITATPTPVVTDKPWWDEGDDDDNGLPPGWDSPESPYSNGKVLLK